MRCVCIVVAVYEENGATTPNLCQNVLFLNHGFKTEGQFFVGNASNFWCHCARMPSGNGLEVDWPFKEKVASRRTGHPETLHPCFLSDDRNESRLVMCQLSDDVAPQNHTMTQRPQRSLVSGGLNSEKTDKIELR